MSEVKELSIEPQKSPEKIIEQIRAETGIANLELDPDQLMFNEQGKLRYFATKIIWDGTPRADDTYHGVSFFYDSASGKKSRLAFGEGFNDIVVQVEWIGNKIGEVIEPNHEEASEVIMDW